MCTIAIELLTRNIEVEKYIEILESLHTCQYRSLNWMVSKTLG